VLVDGIYLHYLWFVQGIKSQIGDCQQQLTAGQEGARKDVEHAFGMLKGRFQFVEQPIHVHHLLNIGKQMMPCLILHNIFRADYVMGNKYWQVYNPAYSTIK
jgi:Plant transposon protein